MIRVGQSVAQEWMVFISAATTLLLFLLLFLLLSRFLRISGEFNVRVRIEVLNSIRPNCASTSYLLLRLTVRI